MDRLNYQSEIKNCYNPTSKYCYVLCDINLYTIKLNISIFCNKYLNKCCQQSHLRVFGYRYI